MENTYSSSLSLTVLQLTDMHLFSQSQQTLMGIDTRESLQQVVVYVQERAIVPDLILCTGDIAQDCAAASYQSCIQALSVFQRPIFWVPGNHDDVQLMRQITPNKQVSWPAQKICLDPWVIVLLSSHSAGCVHGFLGQDQLYFLQQTIEAQRTSRFIVALHHHPGAVCSRWLDQHNLHNGDALLSILEQAHYPSTVICGHVHQASEQKIGRIQIFSTPSTCFQFKPRSNRFALDKQRPGFRVLSLYSDGSLQTQVYRLQTNALNIDTRSAGY